MAVKALSYEWTCDWCGLVEETEMNKPPDDWTLPERGWLHVYEPEHLCRKCPERIRHADLLALELRKEVSRKIKRFFSKKELHEVPEPFEGIDVALIGEYAPSLEDQEDE